MSPARLEKVRQIGGSYALPIYSLGGILSAYAANSNVDTGTVGASADGTGGAQVTGAGTFYGLSFTYFLRRIGGYTHSVSFGVEDKKFVNDSIVPPPPDNPLRYDGMVAASVFPSPVRISAIIPWWRAPAPMTWTS